MCGIVGYIGPKSVVPVIIEGLRRLEYRGYDSAGIAVGGSPESRPTALELRRAPGKLRNLEAVIENKSPIARHVRHRPHPLGHPRPPHRRKRPPPPRRHRQPSSSCTTASLKTTLQLKQALIAKGHKFQSETDTEIIAHLIQDELELAQLATPCPRSRT